MSNVYKVPEGWNELDPPTTPSVQTFCAALPYIIKWLYKSHFYGRSDTTYALLRKCRRLFVQARDDLAEMPPIRGLQRAYPPSWIGLSPDSPSTDKETANLRYGRVGDQDIRRRVGPAVGPRLREDATRMRS